MENSFGVLRKTEEILLVTSTQYASGQCRMKAQQFTCEILIVSTKGKSFEQAIFILKQELLGGYQVYLVCPLTFELHVFPRDDFFALSWGENCQLICELNAEDAIIRFITRHCNDYSRYQTIPFNAYSSKHRWIWYYKEYIPEFLYCSKAVLPYSHNLLFDHYGKPIMSAYVEEILNRKSAQFTVENNAKIIVLTWNAAGLQPAGEIRSALRGISERNTNPGAVPDFIVIGMQEICFLGKVWGDLNRENQWSSYLSQQVSETFGNDYKPIFQESLVGILTLVYCKSQLLPSIKRIVSKTLKLGLKGYAGNKGAVGVRFEIFNTSICLVNVHLIHNTDKFQDRNKNVFYILKNLKFRLNDIEVSIDEHDQILWFGDFNYRIDMPSSTIKDLVKKQNIKTALKFDQLNKAHESYAILPEYLEGEILFLPTFKFEIGSDDYNLKRDPAWCDRVLYKGDLRLTLYDSCNSVRLSDHKPVFAHFDFQLKKVDENKKSQIFNETLKEIDQEHHRGMPNLKLSCSVLDFGKVYYKIMTTKRFSVSNTGDSEINFQIESEDWARCMPNSYLISGRKTVEVEVNTYVDCNLLKVYRLAGKMVPSFIRVVVNGGPVYMIEIKFEVAETIIGQNIDLQDLPCQVQLMDFAQFLVENLEKINYVQELLEPEQEIENLGETIRKIEMKGDVGNLNLYHIIHVFWDFAKNMEPSLINGGRVDSLLHLINIETPLSILEKFLDGIGDCQKSLLVVFIGFFSKLKIRLNLQLSYISLHFFKIFYQTKSISQKKRKNRELFLELLLTHLHNL